MKFKNLSLMTLLVGLNSFTLAAEEDMSQNKKTQVQKSPSLGDKLPPYNNPNRFLVDLSFIYWQASEDGLEYGLSEKAQESVVYDVRGIIGPTTNTDVGYSLSGSLKDQKMDFKWDPGFKAGIGLVFGERDQWDLLLNWTWLQSTAQGSYKGDQSISKEIMAPTLLLNPQPSALQYTVPSWGPVVLGGPAANATSHWRLHYNTLDLELGRNFFLSKNLTLRPHIGLRGASLHQNIKAQYDSILNGLVGLADGVPVPTVNFGGFSPGNQFKGKNDYDAGGLRGGLDANWNFTNCFAVYGKISGALLYGRFKVEETYNSINSLVVNVPGDPLGSFVFN